MQTFLDSCYRLVWGQGTVFLLVSAGFLLLCAAGFYPLRHPLEVLRRTVGGCFRKKSNSEEISPFDAMAAALGGTMGVGNIVGVAAALAAGGAGAVFWLWVAGLCGMMLKYGEVFLAVKYRVPSKDGWLGGPMYYIRDGLGSPILAGMFAVCCTAASFGMGNMAQTNAAVGCLVQLTQLPAVVLAAALGGITACVIFGGMRRIVKVSALIVPLMSLLYLAGASAILIVRREAVPAAFAEIFKGAFGLRAMGGASLGLLWQAVQAGITKGIFTNEAGLGSASIAHACAEECDPHKQGLWGIFEVFADTLLVCTLTGLVILTSQVPFTQLPAGQVTAAAFSAVLGSAGGKLVELSVIFFAMASIFSWCLYGERSLEYLGAGKKLLNGYRICFIFFAVLGGVIRLEAVWQVSDILNGMMLFPNLLALGLLCPIFLKPFRNGKE